MATVGGSVVGSPTVTISEPTTRTQYYIDAPVASTEVSQSLSANVKKLIIYVESLTARSSFSFTAAQSAVSSGGTLIPEGCAYTMDDINVSSPTLYIQTNKASQKIIVEEWT